MKKATEKYTQEWVELYNNGLSLREIGKKYGSISVYKHKIEILGCVDGIKENVILYLSDKCGVYKDSIIENGKDRIFIKNKNDREKIVEILKEIQKDFSLFNVIKE